MTLVRESFQSQLDALQRDVLVMGETVAKRLEAALRGLTDGDVAAAEAVIEGDDEINQTYLELESDCVALLALQQPVASDLRLVVASFKIITDLERVGDLAVNIAEYALGSDAEIDPATGLDQIGGSVADLLRQSLDVYESGNGAKCHEIAAADDSIDDRCRRAAEQTAWNLIEHEAEGADGFAAESLLGEVSLIMLALRDLERVSDHAVNIAARTLYAAENDPELVY